MDGFEIPIGADFSAMDAALERIVAAIDRMGDRLVAAMAASQAATARATASMGQMRAGSAALAGEAHRAGASAGTASGRFLQAAHSAGALGHSAAGIAAGMKLANRAATALMGVNLAARLRGWLSSVGGLRGAFASIPRVLRAIATNRTFQIVAAGALAAVAAVVAFRTGIRAAGAVVRGLRSIATGVFHGIAAAARAAGNAARGAFRGVMSLPGKILGSIPGLPIAGMVGAAGALALLVTQARAGSQTASEIQRVGMSLEVLTGSAAGAQKVLDSMRDTWIRTGNSIATQAPTIQKFIALGFSPDDAVQLSKNLLDVAGAVGMTSDEAALLGSALAQVKAKGVVSMEELRQQIAEKGVPVFEELARKLGVTQGALQKLVADGKVPASALLEIFQNMEGTFARFAGGATRMGGTFAGLMSRLRGQWSLLLADFMAPIHDALSPALQGALAKLGTLTEKVKAAGAAVGHAISIVFASFEKGRSIALFGAGLRVAVTAAMDVLMRGLRGGVAFLAAALPPLVSALMAKMSDPMFFEGVKAFFDGVASKLSAAISLREDDRDAWESAAESSFTAARGLMGKAGGVDMGEEIAAALRAAGEAAREAAGGPESTAFAAAKAELAKITGELSKAIRATVRAATPPPAKPSGTPAQATPAPAAAVGRAIAPAVQSLTRVGGGGFASTVFSNLLGETKRHTKLLTAIEKNTAKPASPTAVYA